MSRAILVAIAILLIITQLTERSTNFLLFSEEIKNFTTLAKMLFAAYLMPWRETLLYLMVNSEEHYQALTDECQIAGRTISKWFHDTTDTTTQQETWFKFLSRHPYHKHFYFYPYSSSEYLVGVPIDEGLTPEQFFLALLQARELLAAAGWTNESNGPLRIHTLKNIVTSLNE